MKRTARTRRRDPRKPVKPVPGPEIDPRKRKVPREIVIDRPVPPCPHSPEQLERLIARAVEFIIERQKAHSLALGFEVGDHLFFELYLGNEQYVRALDPTKEDSPADVANATGIPYSTLYLYLTAAMARHKLEQAGVTANLDLKHFAVLARLNDDLDTMCALATLAERNDIPYRRLDQIVDDLEQHVAQGGTLADLVGPPDEPKPKNVRRESRVPARILRARRMLEVIGKWWFTSRLSRPNRQVLRTELLRVRAMLVGAGS